MLDSAAHLTIRDLQLLRLIGRGIDNRRDLVEASDIPERTVFRRVDCFRGGVRYQDGKVVEGYPPLVLSRKHPHQAGMQFFLSPEGEAVLQAVAELTGRNAVRQAH
ncbi:MAG: hypothetical protein ACPGPH_07990 [Synechococcus sp.]